ncbi:MAG: PqqD family protein, partial [Acidobacteriota bacterium]|nr:PqqD family protein [Acidobacteriota bacterium]
MKALPLARQSSLIVKELEDETLVYDQETDQAHCLNETAALVWKNCDGRNSVNEIARLLSG